MADKKISQLNAVLTLGNNDLFPVVQGADTKKAKISDIKSYLPTASSLNTGLLSNTDWTTFNNKQNALTLGNLTESTSSVLTITGGTGSIIGSGTTIQVKQASGSQSGFLSSTDWTTFNNKMTGLTLTTTGTSGAATYNSGTATLNIPQYLGAAVTSINGSTTAAQTIQTGSTGTDFTIGTVAGVTTVAIPTASASARGLLSTTDWSTFNGKQNALTIGNLTESTSSVLTITGGTGSVIGSGTTIEIKKATGSQDGYLASSDFTTFAGKQNAITLTTTGSSGAATFIGNVLNIPQYGGGGVTSVGSTSPINSSGGTTPTISIDNAKADGTSKGAAGFNASDFNDNGSGIISLDYTNAQFATSSVNGFLKSSDWSAFDGKQNAITLTTTGTSGAATLVGSTLNIPQYSGGGGGITTLNTLTAATQTFATGTTGSDFNISSATSTHTFNIPDAGASARGLITTGTQTIAGSKTFSSAPTFSTMTAGSILFAGTSGLLSQDNTNLFWDNTNKRLGIGTASPSRRFHVSGSSTASSGTAIGSLFNQTLVASANNDSLIALDISPTYTNGAFTNVSNIGLRVANAFTFGYNLSSGTGEIKSLASNGAVDFLGVANNTGSFNFYGGGAYNTGGGVTVGGQSHVSYASAVVFWRTGFTQNARFTANGNLILGTSTLDSGFRLDNTGTSRFQDNITITDNRSIILGTSVGNRIGSSPSQKIGFWNATPIVQPTTAVAGATRVGGAGTTVTDTDTFDGYTIAQVVKALRNSGLLA